MHALFFSRKKGIKLFNQVSLPPAWLANDEKIIKCMFLFMISYYSGSILSVKDKADVVLDSCWALCLVAVVQGCVMHHIPDLLHFLAALSRP